jgi:hypothetical protein
MSSGNSQNGNAGNGGVVINGGTASVAVMVILITLRRLQYGIRNLLVSPLI